MPAERILLIEDEPGARDALGSLLLDEGYAVRTAESGRAGIACVREFQPDTIVCDVVLPDINGLQVLRQVRALAKEDVVFIIVTAGGSSEEVERALRREADLFIEKPIDLHRFRSVLKHLLPSAPHPASDGRHH
jgi:two-component system, sensor histidine kinase and response regulator